MEKVYGAPPNHYSIYEELEEIKAKLQAETNRGSAISEWYNMFFAPRMGYRILLGVLLQMFQQLTGANYFFYYGTTIFQSTGINNSFVTQMILNGINLGVTPIGIYLVEAAGRRVSLIIGSTWMFLMFLIFASCGRPRHQHHSSFQPLTTPRTFLPRPPKPTEHRIDGYGHDRHRMFVHPGICDNMGQYYPLIACD